MISYVITVLITIVLFAYIFWTLSIFDIGYLQFNTCNAEDPALRSENWFYFSSVTFYSLGYGDICPVNHATRVFSQIEVAIGALINTLLIGFIFWKVRELDITEELEKKGKIKISESYKKQLRYRLK